MNNFKRMWDFGTKEGIHFLHCNRVHPLMQGRVQKVLQILEQDPNIQKIVLFGSSLEFRCSSFSDLDLYIEKAEPSLPLKNEPSLDCEIDFVMDLNHNSSLYKEIDRTGLLLFERGQKYV